MPVQLQHITRSATQCYKMAIHTTQIKTTSMVTRTAAADLLEDDLTSREAAIARQNNANPVSQRRPLIRPGPCEDSLAWVFALAKGDTSLTTSMTLRGANSLPVASVSGAARREVRSETCSSGRLFLQSRQSAKEFLDTRRSNIVVSLDGSNVACLFVIN